MALKQFLAALALAASLFAAGGALATAQAPDVLIMDGEPQSLDTNPLAPYLRAHPDALPRSEYSSSGNWRGYVATWEVTGGRLLLRKIDVAFPNPAPREDDYSPLIRNVIDEVFPGEKEVVATWYSGTLIIPSGKMLEYVHMGYGSTFEHYTLVTVSEGSVIKSLDLDAEQFKQYRDAQFAAFQRTPEYAEKAKALAARDASDPMDDASIADFLYSFESERYLSIDFSTSK